MQAIKINSDKDFDLSTLTISSLNTLYGQTLDGLKKCSQAIPGEGDDEDSVDDTELSLLEFEMSVLNNASKIPLKNPEDVNQVIDLWAKASGINTGIELRPTDKIVLNIFRHLSGRLG